MPMLPAGDRRPAVRAPFPLGVGAVTLETRHRSGFVGGLAVRCRSSWRPGRMPPQNDDRHLVEVAEVDLTAKPKPNWPGGVWVSLPASSLSNRMLLMRVGGPRRVAPRFAFEGGQSWGRSVGETTVCSRGGLRGQVGLAYAVPGWLIRLFRGRAGRQSARGRDGSRPCIRLAVCPSLEQSKQGSRERRGRGRISPRWSLRSTGPGAVLPEAFSCRTGACFRRPR